MLLPPRAPSLLRLVLVLVLVAVAAPLRAQSAPPVPDPFAGLLAEFAATRSDAQRLALLEREAWRADEPLRLALQRAGTQSSRDGDDDATLALYASARLLAEKQGNRLSAGFAILNSAAVYGRRGDYTEALRLLDESTRIGTELRSADLISSTLNDRGIVFRLLGELDLALDAYRRSLALSETEGALPSQVRVLNNLGIVSLQQGKYREALDYLERSLALKRQSSDAELGSTLLNIGNVYLLQGNTDTALRYYLEARTLNEAGRRNGLPTNLAAIGHAHERQQRYDEAEADYRAALAQAEELGQRPLVAASFYNLGQLSALRHQPQAAIVFLDQALTQFETLNNKTGIAETLVQRAAERAKLGDAAGAEADNSRALQLAVDSGLTSTSGEAEFQLGELDRRAKRLEPARRHYERAVGFVEALQGEVAGGEVQLAQYLDQHIAPYHGLVELETDAGHARAALDAAERSRAQMLLGTLRYGRTPITKAMTPDEVTQERALRQVVTTTAARLASLRSRRTSAASEQQALEDALETARDDASRFEARMFAVHPELRVYRAALQPLTDEQLASILPAGRSAAIEFAVLASRTLAFVVTRDAASGRPALRTYDIAISREQLEAKAASFRERMEARDLTIRAAARELFTLLLGPALPTLGAIDSLVIVPDGALWDVPFQALETPRGRYLIESMAVSYAPSLTVLWQMQQLSATRASLPGRRAMLAIGSSGVGSPVVAEGADAGAGALPPLVEAERQARSVAALYAGAERTLLVGASANVQRVRAEMAGHRVVHVAAHSVLDNASPLESYLVLSPGDTPMSSLVAASTLMDLSLDADLVVLSGCETARGRIGAGEGVMGMTWALFVAGTPSTVVSQWAVGAASTTDLMREFHRRLQAQQTPAAAMRGRASALRQASLAMLRSGRYAHPYYWAPFVLMGDAR